MILLTICFFYPDYIAPMSSLSKTMLHDSEKYWYIPRAFFDRRGVNVTSDYFNMNCGESVEIAREFLLHTQARGENYMVSPQPILLTEVGLHSQGIL